MREHTAWEDGVCTVALLWYIPLWNCEIESELISIQVLVHLGVNMKDYRTHWQTCTGRQLNNKLPHQREKSVLFHVCHYVLYVLINPSIFNLKSKLHQLLGKHRWADHCNPGSQGLCRTYIWFYSKNRQLEIKPQLAKLRGMARLFTVWLKKSHFGMTIIWRETWN